MYNLKFFKTRLHYVKTLLPFLTARKVCNFLICTLSYILRLERSGRVPPIWILILTYRCNYSCIMCQKSSLDDNPYKKPQSIDFEKIEKILRANHKDILLIQLLGGEPLYYTDIIKVIGLLDELNIAYCLATNGSLLSKEISQRLIKSCVWISISLDAADPEIFRSIRRGGNIDTISQNLHFINQLKLQEGKSAPILNANATLFSYNIQEVSPLLYFCKDHKIKSFSVSGGKLYNTPFVNENNLVRSIKTIAIEFIEEAKVLARHLDIIFRVGLRSLYSTSGKKRIKRTYDNCRDLYFEVTIQPDLNVAAAGEDYLSMGNLNEKPLPEIWNEGNNGYKMMRLKRKQERNSQ